MRSIFSLFLSHTSLQQKKLILAVTFLFGLLSPGLIGIAVWFKEPALLCREGPNSPEYPCTQSMACSDPLISYRIDPELSSDSISTLLSIVCGRKSVKRTLVSSYFFGGVIGCIANILIYISARRRKNAISILGIIYGLANIGLALSNEELSFAMFLGVLSFTWIVIHSYCFMIMNENFQGDLAKSVIMIMMLFWGFSGILYSIVAYIMNANFRVLFMVLGAIAICTGAYLWVYKPETEPKALSKLHRNVFGLIKEMWQFKQITFNVVTFVISWSAFCVTYNDVFLKLETIGGSLYLSIGVIAVFEMSASFISGIISMKFPINRAIKFCMIVEICLGILFLLAPIEVQHLTVIESTVLLFSMIMTKFSSDVINNLINLYAPKVFTDEFIGIFLILSRLSSRIFLLALPTINYGFESFKIHPFFFLSLLWGFCYMLNLRVFEIQEEGIHDVLSEFKVNLAARVSVIHNSEHLHVDDVLSNIFVDDKRLSEIRSSRILLRKTRSVCSVDSGGRKDSESVEACSLEKKLLE